MIPDSIINQIQERADIVEIVSGFVALTLTPMMSSVLLRHQKKSNIVVRVIERALSALENGYRRSLQAVVKVRWLVMVLAAVVAGCGRVRGKVPVGGRLDPGRTCLPARTWSARRSGADCASAARTAVRGGCFPDGPTSIAARSAAWSS